MFKPSDQYDNDSLFPAGSQQPANEAENKVNNCPPCEVKPFPWWMLVLIAVGVSQQ